MMKTFTRSDVLSWRPCHGAAGTRRIMRGLPRKMTALDVLRHEAATPTDRLWCVLRSDVLSERTLRLFAAWCARTALDAARAARAAARATKAASADVDAADAAAYDAARAAQVARLVELIEENE